MKNKKIIWDKERVCMLHKFKEQGFSNEEISNELSISLSSVKNAAFKYHALLSPELLKKSLSEASKKGYLKQVIRYKSRGEIKNFDQNLGYIIGVLYGDGSMSNKKVYGSIQLKTTNKSFALAFLKALENYDVKPKYHIRRHKINISKKKIDFIKM